MPIIFLKRQRLLEVFLRLITVGFGPRASVNRATGTATSPNATIAAGQFKADGHFFVLSRDARIPSRHTGPAWRSLIGHGNSRLNSRCKRKLRFWMSPRTNTPDIFFQLRCRRGNDQTSHPRVAA